MADAKNEHHSTDELQNCTDNNETPKVNPFAHWEKLLKENAGLKAIANALEKLMGNALTSKDTEIVECIKLNGIDYVVVKELEVDGNRYVYLANENDVTDFMIHKLVVENGKTYIVGLDSENEFKLALAYFQREFFVEAKDNNATQKDD